MPKTLSLVLHTTLLPLSVQLFALVETVSGYCLISVDNIGVALDIYLFCIINLVSFVVSS